MSTITKKIISMLIVFVIIFTYMGGTLEAIATTDGISAITNGFFGSSEMNFSAYFEENTNKNTEKISDVNDKTTITFEVSPKEIGKGFLKEGRILANGVDGSDTNFKFVKIKNVIVDDPEAVVVEETSNENIENKEDKNDSNFVENKDEESKIEENTTTQESIVNENNSTENNVIEEDKANETVVENTITENDLTENNTVENEIVENTVNNDIQNDTAEKNNESESVENRTVDNDVNPEDEILIQNGLNGNKGNLETTSRSSESRETQDLVLNDELINEEKVIEDKIVEIEESYEELTAKDFEIEVVDENQIKVQNVIYNTKIEVEIEFTKNDELEISDLYKEINLQLEGKYININLERKEIATNQKVIVGWNYSKEFEITSEYTQISPFQLSDHKGTIIENKIILTRKIEDEKYLPIKKSTIEIDVPEYNGNMPETVNVQTTKLMATRGEDLGEVTFEQKNWNYDSENKKIIINVENETNGKARNSIGEDEYIVVYRYSNYTEDEKTTMDVNVKATVEEYNSNNNIITTKEIHNKQEISAQPNELITYNIGTNQTELNKAKINANYNSEEALYESEYISTVNVNILTSDVLEQLKINSSKEVYLDSNQTEFDATNDVYYNKVKFNYSEIKNILKNGASIELQSVSGELLYTLTDEIVTDEDSCEIKLASKEKGIYVIFKNISVNGNIAIEFTKAIGKSNYDKSAFSNFKEIKSCVTAELKYKNYEELYGMPEICTTKKLVESRTVAEINLTNNNLTTMAQNENVEVRIALNNDKQDSDLYINPSFELVFPRYVKNVNIQNVNLLYACGLRISDYQTYVENDLVKLKVNLEGIQNRFSDSIITDGTNIVLNLNIELDEYIPRKQDQIKMYYCNEGVTNYESQTNWSISKPVPNGIIKETNGFDVAVINYQAPKGMITSNAIINYDGQASKIKSINQGEKTVEIKAKSNSQIATMELVAMNNTGNTCTDVIFIGRIPFEGNKSVVSGKDLGTTATVKMLTSINENIQNVNMTTVYYSNNENASKDLRDESNGWTTEVSDWSQIKSYMIVVKGEVKAGTVLKYTYDFEIPENLEYEKEIYGSFGGYFNNKYETVTSYESTEADKVGMISEKEPKVKVSVEPYGENKNIYYGQILTLVAKVENNSNENIQNSILNVSIPEGTVYTEYKTIKNPDGVGSFEGYEDDENIKNKEFNIENLACEDIVTFQFDVRVLENEKDSIKLNGTIELNNEQKAYSLKANKGKISVYAKKFLIGNDYFENDEIDYIVNIKNLSDNELNNLNLIFKLPEYLQIEDLKDEKGNKIEYFVENKIVTANIGKVEDKKEIYITFKIKDLKIENVIIENIFSVYDNNTNKKYDSNLTRVNAKKSFVNVKQSINKTEFNYGDNFEYRLLIENKSNIPDYIDIKLDFPKQLYFKNTKIIVNGEEKEIESFNNLTKFEELLENGTIEIVSIGEVTDWNNLNSDLELSHIAHVSLMRSGDIESNEIKVKINKSEKKSDEDVDKLEEYTEDENVGQYSLSGNVFVDSDNDGQNNYEEPVDSQVQVQLLKGSTMVKATTTDSNGNYSFDGLESGDYSVVFNYDENEYTSTAYNAQESENELKAFEIEEGKAVTDTITIADQSVENVNTGLQEKEKFDLQMKQYIFKAIVNIDGEEKEYDYEDLELAKLEIKSSDLEKATVKIVYKLVVENVGNIDGQVTSIVDYIPNGLMFNEADNKGWSKGAINGNVYYDGLKGENITPGESKEITLVLTKKMTEDNTGIISNKAKIAYTESATRLTECTENNFATQETIVTVTQGANGKVAIIITTSMLVIVSIFAYMVQSGKIQISLNLGKGIKKVYK